MTIDPIGATCADCDDTGEHEDGLCACIAGRIKSQMLAAEQRTLAATADALGFPTLGGAA